MAAEVVTRRDPDFPGPFAEAAYPALQPTEGIEVLSYQEIGGSDEKAAGMGLRDYVRVARTYWKSITAVTLGITLAVMAWSALQPRVYAAEASAVVLAVGTDNVSTLLQGDTLAKARAKNYKSLAESRLVADNVRASLGLSQASDDLLKDVTVTVPLESAEIYVKAESDDPATAQKVADAWITELAKQVRDREAAAASGQPAAPAIPRLSLIPLDAATVPTAPASPGLALATIFGLAGGLLLAYASALLRNHLDRRLRTADDVERLSSLPVIAALPVEAKLKGDHTGAVGATVKQGGAGHSPAFAESLRELRTNLAFLDVDNPPRIIVVSSSVSGEGKSTVAANLAATMAAAGEKVVVVDGDLRHPSVAKIFGVVPGVGVTDILTGKAELDEVLQQRGDLPNLSILGAGRIPPNPSELLSSHAMKHLIDSLAERAIVIIDAPPLLPVTDAVLLSRIAHGAIVVVRAGRTTTDQLRKALGNLRKVNASVLGTLINGLPAKEFDGYTYYTPEPEAERLPIPRDRSNAHETRTTPRPAAVPLAGNEKARRSVPSS
ncbi:polysaccharide biosynthesis tyrosine autokinase [Arthrobacter sp. FW306-05-C]|uniref:polysaccharide biosynthesis tyrosine autokinase n=1 Tax=unclassified Arthrobacter TaxID=235627 RepID=UPI001EF05C3A|nr:MULTISPECIES: polysaccharide biosynthesis tyrosine autokinase [unclassified Arthrobacter]UKA66831.1 polysaccharide biosynthesis tyrosine autokinase [Arthrobacter sp. FW306-05-C]UKA75466.1 polysaccharide biosynthesis tyrosine autokinase [Arthrobacter sp. FW306-07-I]